MKMIAGLGNPGTAYANTPHNVGFDVVDELAQRLEAGWKNSSWFHAHVARTAYAGETLMLVKPQTFMNLSGTSVAPLLRYYGGAPDDPETRYANKVLAEKERLEQAARRGPAARA